MKWKWSQIAGEMQSRNCRRAVGHQPQPGDQIFPSGVFTFFWKAHFHLYLWIGKDKIRSGKHCQNMMAFWQETSTSGQPRNKFGSNVKWQLQIIYWAHVPSYVWHNHSHSGFIIGSWVWILQYMDLTSPFEVLVHV